jgi:Zn-dependent protease with chaperone function
MKMLMRRSGIIILVLLILLAPLRVAPFIASAAPAEDREVTLGRQGAAAIEARYPVVKDPAVVERVRRIGMTLGAVSERPHLPYTFKVVELDQVNALALPGGFVYVTTGLLAFVRSDHELAAVLAHEITHASHGHGMEMMRRANQAAWVTILIAIFTGDPTLAAGANIVSGGLLAGYTRDMERDADLTGITYLSRTQYNPVGMLTLLEHMLRMEQLNPRSDPGAFGDHPTAAERVQYVEAELRARRIPLNRRVPANYLVLAVREGNDAGVAYGEILVNNRPIIRLPEIPRIREAADLLDRLFDTDLEPYEVIARESLGGWVLFARGWPVLRFSPSDVPPGGGSVREFALTIQTRLRLAIDEDVRRRRMQG